ncbi:MAG: NAD-dependent epimerase/dehydratase family protein [Pedosphaera sp.]|nr:NAD-dependent epimerase/dehydratase family protein [Pedosphaera sp.]
MSRHVLVTGGAGFIGSHLVGALHQQGHRVRVLDVFDSQVHSTAEPRFTSEIAECVTGDVRDPETRGASGKNIVLPFYDR